MALKPSMALMAYSVPARKRLQNETGVLGYHNNRESKRKRYLKPLLRPKFGNGMWGVVVRISCLCCPPLSAPS